MKKKNAGRFILFCLFTLFVSSLSQELYQWTLDLTSEEITIRLQGVISIDFSGLDCERFSIARTRSDPRRYRLTGCSNPRSVDAATFAFTLDPSDVTALKLDRGLATGSINTFLVIDSGNGIVDENGDPLMPMTASNPAPVTTYTPDQTQPQVAENGFSLFDLDEGRLTISFDEPVKYDSVTPNTGGLAFQSYYDSDPGTEFVVRDATCVACVDGSEITIQLSTSELNRLKLSPDICSSGSNCWLTLPTSQLATDMADNAITPLLNGVQTNQRYVLSFVDDTSGPILESFSLNFSSNQLLLSFNEPVEASTFNVSGITLQSGPGVTDPTLYYQLRSSTIIEEDSNTITVDLSEEDLIQLQSRSSLATGRNNTFLSLSVGVARDLSLSSNPSVVISAQPVRGFDVDASSPVIAAINTLLLISCALIGLLVMVY